MRQAARGHEEIRSALPDVPVSVDTFRSEVAKMAVEECGADIVNDISGGLLDGNMIATVAALRVPYILMHMRGTPATMSAMCDYPEGVTAGVMRELSAQLTKATDAGICDIIIDPGSGLQRAWSRTMSCSGIYRFLPIHSGFLC